MSEKYVFGELNSGTGVLTATDYTSELGRIATALETIASAATSIDNSLNVVANNIVVMNASLNTVAQKISSIEHLASSDQGIHTVGPYDWLQGADLYNCYALGNRQLPIDSTTLSSLTNYISTATYISSLFPKFK